MIHLSQAVIVEGKYDKIKLKNFLDAEIITTDGFRIFKSYEKCDMIRRIARQRGIIILTDSDSAGFIIRGHLTGIVEPKYITNVYIPEIAGKERRKRSASAEGLLGVEGISEEVIVDALKKAGVLLGEKFGAQNADKITHLDLFKLGLTGADNSKQKRTALLERLKLPKAMSTNQMLTALNSLYSREEIYNLLEFEE